MTHVEPSALEVPTTKADIPPLQTSKDPWQHVIDACAMYTLAKIVTSRTTKSLLRGSHGGYGSIPLDHRVPLNQIKK
eukprot:12882795-Prorocentrum_lima.AAC.1